MSREFEPKEIRTVAGKIGGLRSDLSSAGSQLRGSDASNPFGKLDSAGEISSALSSFMSDLKKEFSAGAKLMSATEKSLVATADNMDADEDDAARSFGGGNIDAV